VSTSSPRDGRQEQNGGHVTLDLLLGHTDRAGSMAAKLRNTAEWAGLSSPDARQLADVFLVGMERRAGVIAEDHPDYLHTARTALILLVDAEVRQQPVLLAALLRDSERPDLELDDETVLQAAGASAAAVLAELPRRDQPESEQLEALVTASPLALTLHIAERLDHLRHLHLGPRERWDAGYAEAIESLLPLADRCHPALARRISRWAGAFRRRIEASGR